MTVRVTRQHGIDRGHPGVEISTELSPERLVPAERRSGDLGEDRTPAAAREPRRRRPFSDLPPRRARAPAETPHADVLHAPRLRAGADDVEADVGADDR